MRSVICGIILASIAALVLVAVPRTPVASALIVDPGDPGPLAVTLQEYTLGDTAFRPTGFPADVEVTASVHRPTDLSGGPFPLVVIMHGRHSTCYSPSVFTWPCPGNVITSYQGYDYIGANLASHGYIVVSVSANGINAFDNLVFDLGALARAELIQLHLDIWSSCSTSSCGPFGSTFVGKVDMDNVGTMGHSRGGEGVVQHHVLNGSLGAPYGINAVLPIAPVDFSRSVINNVPLEVILPYCDGDVSDNQGVHFYDDALYNVPGDTGAKHTVQVLGANHNFFNTVWTPGLFPAGTVDDWTFVFGGSSDPQCGSGAGSPRLTATQQRGVGLAYNAAFFRTYLGGEPDFLPMLTDNNPPPSALTDEIFIAYHAPDSPALRRDVNRLATSGDLSINELGGSVTQTGMTPHDLCGGEAPQVFHCLPLASTSQQPHTAPSARSSKRGLGQLRSGWDSLAALFQNDLPAGFRDISPHFPYG